MRHGKKFNHLSRKSAHRKAMLANMACSLIEHKRIKTTLAKAKALRVFVEPLITKSKNDTTHSRRVVFSHLKQKHAITELFSDIATKVANRAGGYTRILKLDNRLGDNAQMAYIELVDYNLGYTTSKISSKKARRVRKKKVDNLSSVVEEANIVAESSEESSIKDKKIEENIVDKVPKNDEKKTDETLVEKDPKENEKNLVKEDNTKNNEESSIKDKKTEENIVDKVSENDEKKTEETLVEKDPKENEKNLVKEDNPKNNEEKGE